MTDIVDRLRSSEPLPACPYDRISPHYWTAPNDKPCYICGQLNDPDAPDLCRGADTRIMGEAADEITRLRAENEKLKDQVARLHVRCCAAEESGNVLVERVALMRAALEEIWQQNCICPPTIDIDPEEKLCASCIARAALRAAPAPAAPYDPREWGDPLSHMSNVAVSSAQRSSEG